VNGSILPSLALALLLAGTATCYDAEDLRLLLPGEFLGFSPYEGGPDFFVSWENLTGIYDGGYMTYVDRGVLTVLSQAYIKESAYYTVVLHGMNSDANASGIVAYFREVISGGSGAVQDFSVGDGGFEYSDQSMGYIYFSVGDLFVALEGTGAAVQGAMALAGQNVAEKAIPEISYMVAGAVLAIGHAVFFVNRRTWNHLLSIHLRTDSWSRTGSINGG
jgi:hypothetical protein